MAAVTPAGGGGVDALWLALLRVPLAALRALRPLEAQVDALIAAARTQGVSSPAVSPSASLASGALALSARIGLLRASLARLCDHALHRMATQNSLSSVARRLVDAAREDGDAGSVRPALREALSSCRHEVEALAAVCAALRHDATSSLYALKGARASAARGKAIAFLDGADAGVEPPAFALRAPGKPASFEATPSPLPRIPGALPDEPALGRSVV